jgi:single-strand DNA-binding protein
MNECIFLGNLVHNPELKTITKADGGETSVCNFTIAVSRKFKKNNGESGKQVSYIPCELWDKAAVLVSEHFKKGSPILVRASARNDSYTTSDGRKVSQIKFRVESFEFINYNKEEMEKNDNN